MSGAFVNPHALTGGAGYKANPTYDEFLRKHSGFYRRHSAAGQALEEDRRRSSVAADDAAAAAAAVEGGVTEATPGTGRKSSISYASGGAASANIRKGSVVVASSADRRDSVFGLEASAGTQMDPGRRPSTSLAQDLLAKMRGGSRKGSASAPAAEVVAVEAPK